MTVTITMGGNWKQRLNEVGDASADGTIPLKQFAAAEKADIGLKWARHAKAEGGIVRGQRWEGFKPQYTRNDGTVVPAWGGVAKVRGSGTVQGKKRPSGARVDRSSVLNKDEGHTRQSVISSRPRILRKQVWELAAQDLTDYAEYIFAIGNRNPLRFDGARSRKRMTRVFNGYLDKLAKRFNR